MALGNIPIPLYSREESDKLKELFIDEFAGRCMLTVRVKGQKIAEVAFYWGDLERAWKAVKVD